MSVPIVCSLAAHNCPLDWGYLHYQPSLAGNGLFLSIFALLIPPSIYLGIKHRTYVFTACITTGLVSEVIGYVGRILLNSDPFSRDYFLTYLICLTLAPTFMAAAVYLCLARITVVYGDSISRIRPRSYMLIFVCCDVCSLVVQAVGGGMAAVAYIQSAIDLGTHILVAGLSVQVASMLLFMILCAEFALKVRKHRNSLDTKFADLYESRRFKIFLCCLALATLCIFTRSVFRVAELSSGFAGDLAQNEVSFMVLDGAMIVIASSALTLMHPGVGFRGRWAEANYPIRIKKRGAQSGMTTTTEGSGSDGREVIEDRGLKMG